MSLSLVTQKKKSFKEETIPLSPVTPLQLYASHCGGRRMHCSYKTIREARQHHAAHPASTLLTPSSTWKQQALSDLRCRCWRDGHRFTIFPCLLPNDSTEHVRQPRGNALQVALHSDGTTATSLGIRNHPVSEWILTKSELLTLLKWKPRLSPQGGNTSSD